MESERIQIGTLTFRIETSEPIDPHSRRATQIVNAIVKTLNERFFRASLEGTFPAYPVRSEVKEVRRGSLLTIISLYADVIFNTGVVTGVAMAAAKFIKDS